MTRRNITAVCCVLLSCGMSDVRSEEERSSRTPVYLSATAQDIYARQFVFQVKELMRASTGMSLALSEDAAFYQVHLVAMDQDTSGIAYSVVWTLRGDKGGFPSFVTHSVGTCGRGALESCAKTIVASTDERIEEGTKALLEAFKSFTTNDPKETRPQ